VNTEIEPFGNALTLTAPKHNASVREQGRDFLFAQGEWQRFQRHGQRNLLRRQMGDD
jgi:hypothetical protein